MEAVAFLALQGNPDVFQHRQMWEHRRNLKRTHDTLVGNLCRPHLGDIVAVEHDFA